MIKLKFMREREEDWEGEDRCLRYMSVFVTEFRIGKRNAV